MQQEVTEPPRWQDSERTARYLARRLLDRARRMGLRTVQYEDLLSEVWMTWTMCRDGFDPARGVRFNTYFVRSVENNWRDFCRRHYDPMVDRAASIDTFGVNDDGEVEGLEVPDENATQGDQAFALRESLEQAGRDSPLAYKLLQLAAQAPDELVAELRAAEAQASWAREMGVRGEVAPRVLTPRLLGRIFRFNWRWRIELLNGLERLATHVA